MIIGTPTEVKNNEYRVGLIPAGVMAMVGRGHEVLIQSGAGLGSGFSDEEYEAAGARIVETAANVYEQAEMIIKVKEPQPSEYDLMHRDQILFTYLHLAPDEEQTNALLRQGVTGVAYETITNRRGHLPLLTPMSEVAGRMSTQVGAQYLQKTSGGLGMLLGGVPGVEPAEVLIIGGGIVGLNAAKMAIGLGAHVTILERSLDRMRYLDDVFIGRVNTVMSNDYTIDSKLETADLVIGAVLIPGASAPKLISKDQILSHMKPGSVIVDVAVDQGGCIETTRPTTHANPTFMVGEVVQYCVANMPGAVPRTSTFALTNVTVPYALTLADLGIRDAIKADPYLKAGVNTYKGHVTHKAVADSQEQHEYVDIETLLD